MRIFVFYANVSILQLLIKLTFFRLRESIFSDEDISCSDFCENTYAFVSR